MLLLNYLCNGHLIVLGIAVIFWIKTQNPFNFISNNHYLMPHYSYEIKLVFLLVRT